MKKSYLYHNQPNKAHSRETLHVSLLGFLEENVALAEKNVRKSSKCMGGALPVVVIVVI